MKNKALKKNDQVTVGKESTAWSTDVQWQVFKEVIRVPSTCPWLCEATMTLLDISFSIKKADRSQAADSFTPLQRNKLIIQKAFSQLAE